MKDNPEASASKIAGIIGIAQETLSETYRNSKLPILFSEMVQLTVVVG